MKWVLLYAAILHVCLAANNTSHEGHGDIEKAKIEKEVVIINGIYYYISDIAATPGEATIDCYNAGMTLINFETMGEFGDVTLYLNSIGLGSVLYWTSAHSIQGVWTFTGSGSPVIESLWADGQPSEANQEKAHGLFSAASGAMEDYPEDGFQYYMCKERCSVINH